MPVGASFTSVQVTDCDLAGGSVVYYYDPTTTAWAEVPGQTYNAGTGCATFTLGTATTPSLSQLGGTVFGVQDVPPSLSAARRPERELPRGLSASRSRPVIPSRTPPHPVGHRPARRAGPHGQRRRDGHGDGHGQGAPAGIYPVTLTAGDGR